MRPPRLRNVVAKQVVCTDSGGWSWMVWGDALWAAAQDCAFIWSCGWVGRAVDCKMCFVLQLHGCALGSGVGVVVHVAGWCWKKPLTDGKVCKKLLLEFTTNDMSSQNIYVQHQPLWLWVGCKFDDRLVASSAAPAMGEPKLSPSRPPILVNYFGSFRTHS